MSDKELLSMTETRNNIWFLTLMDEDKANTLYLPDGIGCVELDACTDFDKDVARIARISTGSENKGLRADRKLLATLIREDHGSPLEMGLIRFKMKMPLFLVAQLLRHRWASFSQRSGRYVAFTVEYYIPADDNWRMQGRGNKQVSSGTLPPEQAAIAKQLYTESVEKAIATYNQLLDLGVAREQARIVLPEGTYTSLFANLNMRSLMNLLRLRLAPDAQPEFQEYAKLMFSFVARECPNMHRLLTIAYEVERRLKPQYRDLWTDLMAEWDAEGNSEHD
jgi:thymidylate synthase (FAD)